MLSQMQWLSPGHPPAPQQTATPREGGGGAAAHCASGLRKGSLVPWQPALGKSWHPWGWPCRRVESGRVGAGAWDLLQAL